MNEKEYQKLKQLQEANNHRSNLPPVLISEEEAKQIIIDMIKDWEPNVK